MKTVILNQTGLQDAEVSNNKFYAIRNGAIFQKNIHSGGHFIFAGTNWKYGSKFNSIEEVVFALKNDNVKGTVKICMGNEMFAIYKNGDIEILKNPIKQLL